MKKLIIKKDKWARGDSQKNGKGPSTLLNSKDNMCCLGFLARQVFGYKKEDLRDHGTLSSLKMTGPEIKKNKKLFNKFVEIENHKTVESPFISVNDYYNDDDSDRQRKLKKMFKDLGIEVEFV